MRPAPPRPDMAQFDEMVIPPRDRDDAPRDDAWHDDAAEAMAAARALVGVILVGAAAGLAALVWWVLS